MSHTRSWFRQSSRFDRKNGRILTDILAMGPTDFETNSGVYSYCIASYSQLAAYYIVDPAPKQTKATHTQMHTLAHFL
jgi:hypothetical protein